MPDELDRMQERESGIEEMQIARVRHAAETMPEGSPGECDLCGEWAGRLVCGVCAPCRDQRGLP